MVDLNYDSNSYIATSLSFSVLSLHTLTVNVLTVTLMMLLCTAVTSCSHSEDIAIENSK